MTNALFERDIFAEFTASAVHQMHAPAVHVCSIMSAIILALGHY